MPLTAFSRGSHMRLVCEHGVLLYQIDQAIPHGDAASAAWLNEHMPIEYIIALRKDKCPACALIYTVGAAAEDDTPWQATQ